MANVLNLGGMEQYIVATALRAIYRDSGVRSQDVNMYMKPQPIPAGGRLALANAVRELPTEHDSLYVFADLDPLSNWGHPAQHLFFSPKNGSLMHSEWSMFPPQGFVSEPEAFVPLHVPRVYMAPLMPPFFVTQNVPRARRPPKKIAGRRFAILFSGNSNNRHVNDLEFLFRVLCDVYGYKESNIHVLNYDGSLNYDGGPKPVGNWPGDNNTYRMKARIVGAGNQADFDKAFAAVARTLKSSDFAPDPHEQSRWRRIDLRRAVAVWLSEFRLGVQGQRLREACGRPAEVSRADRRHGTMFLGRFHECNVDEFQGGFNIVRSGRPGE